MPLVGEAVVDGHAGVGGERLDRALGGAAELDRVVEAAEHARGVGDRLLVADLRARRVEVGDVRALVVGGDLEGRARARRGLLEDQRDRLAAQARDLVPGELGGLERGGEPEQLLELFRGEVELLEQAAVAEVVHG
jgi:hypothetical protein